MSYHCHHVVLTLKQCYTIFKNKFKTLQNDQFWELKMPTSGGKNHCVDFNLATIYRVYSSYNTELTAVILSD